MSKKIDVIVVATDCQEIKKAIEVFGFEKVIIYMRDSINAEDHSSTESVMLEYFKKTKLADDDKLILSQITNPFLETKDIDNAFDLLEIEGKDSLLTVSRIKRFFWTNQGNPLNYDFKNRPRRQDFDGNLIENGAFYINSIKNILKTQNRLSGKIAVYEMAEHTQFEIDEPHDWIIAENLFRHFHKKRLENVTIRLIKEIKVVITDVDGVLTDAGMYYSEMGDELKKFNTRDGMGFELLRNAGFKTGIITSENTAIVSNRAKKLKVDYLYQGKKEGGKLAAILEICEKENITLNEVAYIGDDINCLNALESVGLAACPSDAALIIKNLSKTIKLETKGGDGVFREFAELILKECL